MGGMRGWWALRGSVEVSAPLGQEQTAEKNRNCVCVDAEVNSREQLTQQCWPSGQTDRDPEEQPA